VPWRAATLASAFAILWFGVTRGAAPLDEDGVQMLGQSAGGSEFRLGTQDPNHADRFQIEKGGKATRETEGELRFWRTAAYDLTYASGGTGKTSRLHVYAGGGTQHFTWRTQRGYLASEADVRNQEFTAYVRVHGVFDVRRAAVSLKIRGGRHSTTGPDLASCTMMTFAPGTRGAVTRFGKELEHPLYDYVTLEPRFPAALAEGRWVGLKLLSYAVASEPRRVVNRLYVDAAPFDEHGRPTNGWRLVSEYLDVEGQSTGRYSKLVDWGGWQTTVRTDGVTQLDFAIVSLREIRPPAD